jgi:sigma-B regulation protein RsbU (phosphoserine phosphatase)
MATISPLSATVPVAACTFGIDPIDDLLLLEKAAQKINSILDLDQLIDKVVNEVAHAFGCVEATIYLHDQARRELVLAGVHGCTRHGKGDRKKVGKEGMVGYVAGTGKMHYAPDVRQDPYYIACEKSTRSEVAIPLQVDGQLVGVFSASHPQLDAFRPEQLRLLEALCAHIAAAIYNARRFQKERREREQMSREAGEARAIQQALLPKSSPWIPGFAITGMSIPAGELGGDWYDFITLDERRWGLVLADVSGKGMAAALLMSATRAMLRSLAEAGLSPGEVLAKLNHLLVEDLPAGRFVTMIYGVLDPDKRRLTFANAGHPSPLLVSNHVARFLDTERGMPLGVGKSDFSEVEVEISPGSRLLFYSDGITEASNGGDEEYGLKRLAGYLARPDGTLETLLADVRSFADGKALQDDATAILLKG